MKFNNESQTLTLNTNPGETYSLEFDFYAIDDWDRDFPNGPDYFQVFVDNVLTFNETPFTYDQQMKQVSLALE